VSFRKVKRLLVAALESGDFGHEPRDVQEERNLLAVGEVSATLVASIVRRTRGQDHRLSPHHADASVDVHIFNPTVDGERWYIKAYLSPDESAMFISVHKS
jgi:hypothetical protein